MIRPAIQAAITLADGSTHPEAPLLRTLFRELVNYAPPRADEWTIHMGYWDAVEVVAREATRRLSEPHARP